MPAPTECFQRRLDTTIYEIDDEALIFDPLTLNTHRLNRTALEIWRRCDGRHAAADIVDRLVNVYDVERPSALSSVNRTLEELARHGLIEANAPSLEA